MKRPWETEDWRKAPGIIQNPTQTNSALAERDYTVECDAPSENLIQIVKGYWIWWCSTHHQPKCLCELHKAQQKTKYANLMLGETAKLVERLLEALHHADFSNGIEAFGVDKGQASARTFINECEATWQSLEEHGATGEEKETP